MGDYTASIAGLHPKAVRILLELDADERHGFARELDADELRSLAVLPPGAQCRVLELLAAEWERWRDVGPDPGGEGWEAWCVARDRFAVSTVAGALERLGIPPEELRSRPQKVRKPHARTLALHDAIARVADRYDRMTVRQLYYQLVAAGLPKTEREYKRVVAASAQMRLAGRLPYRKIADGSRTRRPVYQHGGLSEALGNAASIYRRNYWLDQPVGVEIWCEKDALTGVIQPVCEEYGVTYVAVRGFSSMTLLYESAQAMRATGKPTNVYYFGDHDASGHAISADLEEKLLGHGADATVKRVALLPAQVSHYDLPTHPSKQTDSRHAAFVREHGDASVELDALPPSVLEAMVRASIVENVDERSWRVMEEVEGLEREALASFAEASTHWMPGERFELPELVRAEP